MSPVKNNDGHSKRGKKIFRSSMGMFLFLVLVAANLLVFAAPALAAVPFIASINPNTGPVGTPVVIVGNNFGLQDQSSVVTFNGVSATIQSWVDLGITAVITTTVPEGATTGPVVVANADGESAGVEFTVTGTPTPPIPTGNTWYLAEGCTANGFETYILIQNLANAEATVNVTYNTAQYGNMPRPQAINVPANSRTTFNVNDDIQNVDVSTMLTSDQQIVVERAMYWNNRVEGHDSIGTTTAAQTWYMAEGCTDNGFETWLLIQNPSANVDANVNVSYMTSKGQQKRDQFQVGAGQRYTINVAEDVGMCDVSAKVTSDLDVICERAMYWDGRRGGHGSICVPEASKTWYLAEGSTAWGFDTWLLIENPNDSTAKVNVTYMTNKGPIEQPAFNMGANTRKTIHVSDFVQDADASIMVESDKDVIAERAMYWNNGSGKAGHDTIGYPEPAQTVYLAEGSTAWGFETFVCIQNPNREDAKVTVTYNTTANGAVDGNDWVIPGESRVTINVNDQLPNTDTSIKLTSDLPIVAERPMYWNTRGGGHVSIGWTE